MRQIFLDTETTGLDVKSGHRIVEIAAVEVCNRQLTGRHFHYYLNPERESEASALQIHGLTTEFLQDKPKFPDICEAFIQFIENAELLIHNAPFDVSFLNNELVLCNQNTLSSYCTEIIDTLILAKELHPGKRNNLDALCERYQVDHSHRVLHGALLDSELLAEVYLRMTRGQDSLLMDFDTPVPDISTDEALKGLQLVVLSADPSELERHAKRLEAINKVSKGNCLWQSLND
ncbi:MAG TPA: DNA polymerase III subunit epsilon [Nitrosomonas sp.]|nr:DNA polymerase III subunit epsilon [Nitrosomonas sp.]